MQDKIHHNKMTHFQGCIRSNIWEQLEQIIDAFMKKLRAD